LRLIIIVIVLVGFLVSDCVRHMDVVPVVAVANFPTDEGFVIIGRVNYTGDPDYLPRTIVEAPETIETSLRFDYAYSGGVSRDPYGPKPTWPGVRGAGRTGNIVTVQGRLDVYRDAQLLRTYVSTCTLTVMTGYVEIFSATSKECLLAVRDNIEMQMYEDREFFRSLKQ